MDNSFVLDAWALLAYLQKEEPAGQRVVDLLAQAQIQQARLFISLINVGEVYYRIGKTLGQAAADTTLVELHQLPLTVLPADEEAVLAAANLKFRQAISYADAFAAAAAMQRNAVLLTGDPELLKLAGQLPIEKMYRDPKAP